MVVVTPSLRACMTQEWSSLFKLSELACLRNGWPLLQHSEHVSLMNGHIYPISQSMPVSGMVSLAPSLRAWLSQEWLPFFELSELACLRNGCFYSSSQSSLSQEWSSLLHLSEHARLRNGHLYSSSHEWSSLFKLSVHACLRSGGLYSSSESMPFSGMVAFTPAFRACLSQEG